MIIWMQRVGRGVAALALLSLLARALVPAGFMLAEADAGSGRYLTLEFCDAHAGTQKVVDLDTGKIIDMPIKGKSTNMPQPCVFCATVTAMAAHDPVAELVAFVSAQDVNFAEVRDLRPGRGIAAPPPPATGPPAHI